MELQVASVLGRSLKWDGSCPLEQLECEAPYWLTKQMGCETVCYVPEIVPVILDLNVCAR